MNRFNQRAEAARQADENLLKAMLLLHLQRGNVYVSDLAAELGMNLSTAYSAVGKLAENGYIHPLAAKRGGRRSNKQALFFTPEGEALAQKILERHQIIQGWLIRLGVPVEEADEEACHIEHGITDNTVALIQGHVQMATTMLGHAACAPEIMEEMRARMGQGQENLGLTASEKMRHTIERLGGIAGIERMSSLVARAGGEARLRGLLDAVESLGGVEQLIREKEELLELQDLARSRGGSGGLKKTLQTVDQCGGAEKIGRLAALEKRAGGMERLEAALETEKRLGGGDTVKKLLSASRRFGSVKNMLELLEQERKLWIRLIESSSEESLEKQLSGHSE